MARNPAGKFQRIIDTMHLDEFSKNPFKTGIWSGIPLEEISPIQFTCQSRSVRDKIYKIILRVWKQFVCLRGGS